MKKAFWGVLLITIGVLFFLSNAGILPFDIVAELNIYWPMIFVVFGISSIIDKISRSKYCFRASSFIFPLFLIAGGLILTANRMNLFGNTITFWQVFWPFVIIYIGLSIFTDNHSIHVNTSKKKKYEENFNYKGKGYYNSHGSRHVSIGSFDIGNEPWVLEDADFHVGIGDATINFTTAFIKEGETNVQVTGHVGSLTVLVPSDLAINVVANLKLGNVSIFGNDYPLNPRTVTYKSPYYDDADKRLNLLLTMKVGEIQIKRVC